MKAMSVVALKRNPSRAIAYAEAGEQVAITRRGRPVLYIYPVARMPESGNSGD
jgi:prevent-host-death family protein